MSPDQPAPTNVPPAAPAPAPRPGKAGSDRTLLLLGVGVILAVAAVAAWYCYSIWASVESYNYLTTIRTGVTSPVKLDAAFADADDDLVADPPSDPAKYVDPPELHFAPLGSNFEKE